MILSPLLNVPPRQRPLRIALSTVCLCAAMGSLQAEDKIGRIDQTDKPEKSIAGQTEAETRGKAGAAGQADRFISMVLLLKTPHEPTAEEIAHAVSEGTGIKVTEKDIVQKQLYSLITAGSDKFILNSVSEPYFENAEKLAAELKFHNLGDSNKGSKAWMSLDWVAQEEKSDIKPVYQMIGKMVAKFGIKDIIAIYSPDLDEFALWTPENIKGLESEDPLAVFDHELHEAADKTSTSSSGAEPAKPDANTPATKSGN